MTFLLLLVLGLPGRVKSGILFRSRRRLSPGTGLGRAAGGVFLLLLFRPFAEQHARDFLHPDPAVLKYPGKFKNEEKIAVEQFPIFFFDLPFCDAFAQSLQFLLIYMEFCGLAAFRFRITRTHPSYGNKSESICPAQNECSDLFFVAIDPALESSLGACLATAIFTTFAEK